MKKLKIFTKGNMILKLAFLEALISRRATLIGIGKSKKKIMKPQNFEEKLVWYYMLGTYGWYFLGAIYFRATRLGS